jgi:hypothetical protein
VLGRAAWRILAASAGRGDANAVEAIWQGWLGHPDDERWELLTQCRGERAMADAAFAAVTDPARAATVRSDIGAFSVRRGIVPNGDAERALFYLMAGQPDQHRAADPDGSALAAAYRAAAEPVRAALRQAMADTGGLDLVRVIAGTSGEPARGADVTQAERAYLAGELTRRQDWPRLWRLASDLPLAETVAAVRQLPAGWRPADEAGRGLLARLAAASPAKITELAVPSVTRLDIGLTVSTDCQFAPDGCDVAVRVRRPGSGRGAHGSPAAHFTAVYALPGGRQLETFSHGSDLFSSRTLHLGVATVCVEHIDNNAARLVRHVRGHGVDEVTRLHWPDVLRLALVRDGFVLATKSRLRHGTAEPGSGLRDVSRSIRYLAPHRLASEPRSGRVAVVVIEGLVVLGPDFEVIARAFDPPDWSDSRRIQWIGFCGPSVLITCDKDTGRLRSWQVGPPMTLGATTVLPHTFPTRFQPVPSAGLIMIESQANIGADGMLRPTPTVSGSRTRFFREYLDARTLQPAACPPVLEWARHPDGGLTRVERLYLAPDGGHAALSRLRGRPYSSAGELEVRDLAREEIRELARRPLARSRPADQAMLTDLAARARRDDALAVLGLLQACLDYRFGSDVAVGQAGQPATGADDIAIS